MRFKLPWLGGERLEKVKSVDSGKLGYLEGIRGLAAIAVVFAHILATYYPGASGSVPTESGQGGILTRLFHGLPFGFAVSGHFAVVLFFVLSGFVLTYKYFQGHKGIDLHKQAVKRLPRLAIPVAATVLLSYVLLSSGAFSHLPEVGRVTGSPEVQRFMTTPLTIGDALNNAIIGVFTGDGVKYNPALWTMSVELIGSFVVFGLAPLAHSLKRRWVLYLGAIVILGDSYYTCFVLGMILADVVNNTNAIAFMRDKVSRVYAYVALLIVWVIASFPSPTGAVDNTIFGHLLFSGITDMTSFLIWQYLAAFLLLAVILVRPELQRILNSKIMIWIGGLSFSMYLTHYLILHSLGDSVFLVLYGWLGYHGGALIAALVTISVTLLVSIAWKKYIDDLSVRVSRSVSRAMLKS